MTHATLLDPAALPAGFADAWQALVSCVATPNVFYEPWMALPALALPEARGMRLLAVWSDDRLDGVLPVQPRRVFGGRVRLATQNWDQRVRALGEPLIRTGCEAGFWRAALDALDRAPSMGPMLRLSTLIADSASTVALEAVLHKAKRPCRITRRYERAVLNGGQSSAAHIAGVVRKKVLKEHRRLLNRLADQGAVVFDRLAPEADAGPWIDTLYALELSGWKGRDGVAAAADPLTDRAFREALTGAHALGRLDLHRLTVGDATLAMLAVIEAPGDRAFQLKIAYDEAYASFSPGVLLEMRYLEHALDVRRLVSVDSCARAGHPMIDRIWPDRLPIVTLETPLRRPGARVLFTAMNAVRDARRRDVKPDRVATDA